MTKLPRGRPPLPARRIHPLIETLQRQRCAWGLSIDWLSERSGLSSHSIEQAERGRREPTVRMIEDMAKALGFELALKPLKKYE